MSKNHQSWGQPKRDPIKDLEKLKEDTPKTRINAQGALSVDYWS
jgi:hypothetical protein